MLILGISCLLFVPVFKTVTHLPPYPGKFFGLSIIWITTEILHHRRAKGMPGQLVVSRVLRKIDIPTVLFFLGILTAVSALQSAGHLSLLAHNLDTIALSDQNKIYFIDLSIGLLSAIVDNVPLVAGAMGMYPVMEAGATGYQAYFMVNGQFWEFLAYSAGTGGSILIIGSAAGVAAMGLEKIDFIWYFKRISLLAISGYFGGAIIYYLMFGLKVLVNKYLKTGCNILVYIPFFLINLAQFKFIQNEALNNNPANQHGRYSHTCRAGRRT